MAIDFASGYALKNQAVIADYPFTMACWIYPDVVNIEQAPMALIDKDSVNSYFCDLHVYPNGTCGLRVFNGSQYEETTPTGAISANAWTHLCGVYSSSTSRSAFKNGGGKTTGTATATLGNLDRVTIGAMLFQGQSILQPYNGKVAEVAVWNVALSDAEVAILALGVSPRLVRPVSLKLYYPLVRDIVDNRESTSPTTLNTSVFDHPRVLYSFGSLSPVVPVSAGGSTIADRDGTAAGAGTATGVSADLEARAGTSAGAGAATGQAGAIQGRQAPAAGQGAATGASAAIAGTPAASAGSSEADVDSAQIQGRAGTSTGAGAADGQAQDVGGGVDGSATGQATVTGSASAIQGRSGTSAGTADAEAAMAAIVSLAATSGGTGLASAEIAKIVARLSDMSAQAVAQAQVSVISSRAGVSAGEAQAIIAAARLWLVEGTAAGAAGMQGVTETEGDDAIHRLVHVEALVGLRVACDVTVARTMVHEVLI